MYHSPATPLAWCNIGCTYQVHQVYPVGRGRKYWLGPPFWGGGGYNSYSLCRLLGIPGGVMPFGSKVGARGVSGRETFTIIPLCHASLGVSSWGMSDRPEVVTWGGSGNPPPLEVSRIPPWVDPTKHRNDFPPLPVTPLLEVTMGGISIWAHSIRSPSDLTG